MENRKKFFHNNHNNKKNGNSSNYKNDYDKNKKNNDKKEVRFVSTNVEKKQKNNNQTNTDQKNANQKSTSKSIKNESSNNRYNNRYSKNRYNQKKKYSQKKKRNLPRDMDIFNKFEVKIERKKSPPPHNRFKNKYKKFNAKPRRAIIPYKINVLRWEDCSICNHQIRNMTNAVIDKNTNKLAHFKCVMDKLKNRRNLSGRERVVYLGSGTFGVIEIKNPSKKTFEIKENIY